MGVNFQVKLDCPLDDPKEIAKHQSATLVSLKLFQDYSVAKELLFGIGPELYAEQWILNNILSLDKSFEDLVMIYFTKILRASQNVK